MANDTLTPGTPSLPPSGSARWRIPLVVAVVVLAIIAVTAIAMGDDDESGPAAGGDPSSAAPTSQAASSPSVSAGETAGETASASVEPTEAGPTSSPVIDTAVRDAIEDGFPALVPSGVPAGWTVVTASYVAKSGGRWTILLSDADGDPVTLRQTTESLQELVRGQLGAGVQQTGTVDLGDFGTGTWKVFTAGEQVGIATTIAKRTHVVVAGSGQDSPVELAEQLLTAEDGDMPGAG